ncbi:MAG TPA: carboxypeptidase-like regulatory domain-containing protein, partial [Gemmatimonadaceae bacterium]
MRCIPAVLVLAWAFPGASAQIVRGSVTEQVSGQPLPGVLISVTGVGDSSARHTLTDARGQYAVRLSSGGRYVVSAKRIGVTRYTSDVLTLRPGETRRLDLVLEAFEHRLPVVNVLDSDMCFRRAEQKQRILALWDEVRTALITTQVSREEQLLTGWLSRHIRTLEPRSLRIIDDRHTVAEGLFERPMRSISGDSLRKAGYWRKEDDNTLVFHAPDEQALLAAGFRDGHCFELVTGRDARPGMVGLGFRPRRASIQGGIDGTIWIDAGNFELRFIEFRYTNLMTIPSNPHLGGQVHYLRHPSGAWLVQRWFIRMPQFPEVTTVDNIRSGQRGEARGTLWRIIEEGGGLYTPGLRSWEAPGTIVGTVVDSTGRAPLTRTLVSLSGTPLSAEVDSLGRFRFDSIPPGAYTLLASHPDYASLGQMADDQPLTLEAGQVYQASMRGINTATLLDLLCAGKKILPGQATLRVMLNHAEDSAPIPRLLVWLRWPNPDQKAPLDPITPQRARMRNPWSVETVGWELHGEESATDAGGAVTFCGVPADTQLELVTLRPDDDPTVVEGARIVRLTTFILRP